MLRYFVISFDNSWELRNRVNETVTNFFRSTHVENRNRSNKRQELFCLLRRAFYVKGLMKMSFLNL